MSRNHNKPPESASEVNLCKDKEQATDQMSVLYRAFFEKPGTMLMIARQTNIERASICRRVDTMRKCGLIDIIKFDSCKVTGYKAGYYTTDLSKYFGTSQLSLF